MELTFNLLVEDVRKIGRALLGPIPGYADSTGALTQALRAEEQKRGGPIYDQWIAYHFAQHVSYTLYKGTGTGGITRRNLPTGIDPESVIKIHVPPTEKPVTRMLKELWDLIERFKTDAATEICGSGEGIEFVGTDEERKQLSTLSKWVEMIGEASDPEFHGHALQHAADQLKQALPTEPAAGDAKSYFQAVHVVRDEIMHLHENLGADSALAAWFLVYDDVCQALYKKGAEYGFTQQQQSVQMLKLAEFGCVPPPATSPASLVDTLSSSVGSIGFHAVVAELAEGYLEEANRLIKKAIEAESKDEHGHWLHKASVWLMAAHRIFEGLLEGQISGLPAETRTLYVSINKGAEEDTVRVAQALLFAFQDRIGAKEEEFAHELKALKKSSDQQAVDNLLYQWIDVQYFYPRFYGKQLVLRSEQI